MTHKFQFRIIYLDYEDLRSGYDCWIERLYVYQVHIIIIYESNDTDFQRESITKPSIRPCPRKNHPL